MADVKYSLLDNMDYILQEGNNTFTAMRKVAWGDKGQGKIDIRKWYVNANGDEIAGKGVTLSDDGCNELVPALLKENYGDTKEIINSIKNREDFMPSLVKALNGENIPEELTLPDIEEQGYDPKDIFGEVG